MLRARVWCLAFAWLLPTVVRAQPSATAIVDRVRVDQRKQIDFHAAAFPETLYVGQQTTYQLGVFLTDNARGRLRRNPEFIPPELRGLLSYDLGAPRRVASPSAPLYEALVFQRALFPVAAGQLVVPAPQLSYALPQSSSYFSREERFLVRAESAHLVIKPLPDVGKPLDFTGAVGVLKAAARLDTLAARVGDPLVLTIRITGVGNVKLLPRPVLELDWAGVVAGTERVQVDSSGALIRGTKEFDWILTPTRDGRVVLPGIPYDYFNPYKAVYEVALTTPLEIEVRAGVLALADIGESAALMPLRAETDTDGLFALVAAGVPLESPQSALLTLGLLLLVPLPALLLLVSNRRARAPARSGHASMVDAASERGVGASDVTRGDSVEGDNARRARRALHAALAQRLGVATQELTSRRGVRRLLRRRGVTRAGTAQVLALMDDLDASGFAGDVIATQVTAGPSFIERVNEACRIVDVEATGGDARDSALDRRQTNGEPTTTGASARTRITTLVLLCCASFGASRESRAATLDVQAAAVVSSPRAAAIATYERRLFKDAEGLFSDLVRANPRDANLLSDWGTAAWAAGDTVNAVIAWQRAARLDPLAVDLQEKIALLPPGARGGIADVPMVPVAALQAIAVGLWIAGWAGLTFVAFNRRARAALEGVRTQGAGWMPALSSALLLLAIVAGGFALWGQRALDPRSLEVVTRPETMRVAPGTDADAMGGVSTGDVVRRSEEQGGWQQVEHADGRRGWLPGLRLAPVAVAERGSGIVVPVSAPLAPRNATPARQR